MSERQPNSLHCFVCGVANPLGLNLKFYTLQQGEVIAEYTVPENYQGYPGLVHGGIVAAMLDEVAGRVFFGVEKNPRFMFTARLDVRYRMNVPVGQPLRIVGRIGKDRGSSATSSAQMFNASGQLLAEAEALLIEIKKGTYPPEMQEELGWKVYDD
jgi:acyl-coenzyme A thioesterase PaaI-like protein